MKVIRDIGSFEAPVPCALTIGKFDGIHRGHRQLIDAVVMRARERRERGDECLSAVLTFDVSPVMLLTHAEREAMLAELGVDLLMICPLDEKIVATPADDFIEDTIVRSLRAVYVTCGEDFRFGYKRRGDTELLKARGLRAGFEVEVLPTVFADGRKVSSTAIREAYAAGDIEGAESMLGYPLSITGRVIHGAELGRTIGTPTANMIPDPCKLLPPNGVYFSEARIDGRTVFGVTDIGSKPTVDGGFTGVETHLFDYDGDLYEEELTIRLLHFQRPERRFENVDDLRRQIESDKAAAREYFKEKNEA